MSLLPLPFQTQPSSYGLAVCILLDHDLLDVDPRCLLVLMAQDPLDGRHVPCVFSQEAGHGMPQLVDVYVFQPGRPGVPFQVLGKTV